MNGSKRFLFETSLDFLLSKSGAIIRHDNTTKLTNGSFLLTKFSLNKDYKQKHKITKLDLLCTAASTRQSCGCSTNGSWTLYGCI